MDALLGSKSLPPGIRFHPTDEELCMYYLKRKVLGKSVRSEMIAEVDVYQFAPWDLPAKSCMRSKDLMWYFFCPRLKKYPNGGRSNRATIFGYWKSTGTDRTVDYNNRPVGKIKTLIFHRGKAPKGDRTDWVMHEYRLEDKVLAEQGVAQDSYVICRIYEKSGLGPKNGEHYGAPFVEEEWDSDTDNDDNLEADRGLVLHPEGCGAADSQAVSMLTSIANSHDVSSALLTPSVAGPPVPVGGQYGSFMASTWEGQTSAAPSTPSAVEQPSVGLEALPPFETEEDELDRMLAAFTSEHCQQSNARGDIDIFNGLGDLAGETSSGVNSDWTQYLLDDGFLELKDLED